MLKQKFMVTSNDIDGNLEIKLSSLTRYMQQVATDNVSEMGYGHKELSKERHMWVIIRMQMHINRLPKLDEEFYISTHPGDSKAFLFFRYFEVYDASNKLIACASSSWVVLNYDTRKVVIRPFEKTLPVETDKDDIPLPEKVLGDAPHLVDTRKARYSEVDMNGHINNTRYVDYIQDLHDTKFFKENRISKILINFEKEIMEGDTISLYSNKESPEIIIGKVGEHVSFATKIEYVKR